MGFLVIGDCFHHKIGTIADVSIRSEEDCSDAHRRDIGIEF